jgi:hypothetical protein
MDDRPGIQRKYGATTHAETAFNAAKHERTSSLDKPKTRNIIT